MADDNSADLDDWTFHQAIGMMSAHLGTNDTGEAAMRLIALAARRHESPHQTAVLIVGREIVLGARAGPDAAARFASSRRGGTRRPLA